MRVLITGSRDWGHSDIIYNALLDTISGIPAKDITVIHGDCPTGADALADSIANHLLIRTVKYPADWKTHGKWAGPKRNIEMVENEKPDICLAFPKGISKGTRHCMKVAKEHGVPVITYEG